MLDRLIIRNFKQFEGVDVELGEAVVFVGPNNSGKTTALQALALWECGVRRWSEKREGKVAPKKRSGVTLNRRDLVAVPVPETKLLWRDLRVREGRKISGRHTTENIRVDVEVRGIHDGKAWHTGLEFDYANPESLYCRPLPGISGDPEDDDPIGDGARAVRIAYLPPMSGLATNEVRLDPGAIQVRLGEGRTAEVLRNLCHGLVEKDDSEGDWAILVETMRDLFGVKLDRPEYVVERGELVMSYRDQRCPAALDLSTAGRGLQQTLLLLAFLLGNPGSVLLLDEPDAHLEILRQRQIYSAIKDVASANGSQIIAASHSEVLLNEAAERDVVVAFVGKPHRIDDRESQVRKALESIGFEDYYLAETTGWVLYLEGSTDLDILRAFAQTLGHAAAELLRSPFVRHIGNRPKEANKHFYGLREAKPDLVGVVIVDKLSRGHDDIPEVPVIEWQRREIENYLCFPEVLEAYATGLAEESAAGPLFVSPEVDRYRDLMNEKILKRIPPAAVDDRTDSWWRTVKASDDFLDPVLESFFQELGLPNQMPKTNYHRLAKLVPKERIADEISDALDQVVEVAARAAAPSAP